jgi:hypothetical protein
MEWCFGVWVVWITWGVGRVLMEWVCREEGEKEMLRVFLSGGECEECDSCDGDGK